MKSELTKVEGVQVAGEQAQGLAAIRAVEVRAAGPRGPSGLGAAQAKTLNANEIWTIPASTFGPAGRVAYLTCTNFPFGTLQFHCASSGAGGATRRLFGNTSGLSSPSLINAAVGITATTEPTSGLLRVWIDNTTGDLKVKNYYSQALLLRLVLVNL